MTKEQLNKVLEKHKKWLNDEPGGERADLRRANLQGADLWGANLWRADLWEADLRGANLQGADLWEADLQGANLQGANLRRADLRRADLWRADLWEADLWEADLRGADLRGANLQEANLRGANLQGANLQGANLQEANLQEANLIPNYICPICCPEKGSFIGFKKAIVLNGYTEVIVELEISSEAKRSSATNRKCRCNRAKVLSITGLNGIAEFQQAVSKYDNNFIYEVGRTVTVDNYDDNRWNECSTGIHFFITRKEAVDY